MHHTLLHSCRSHGTSWRRVPVAVLGRVEIHSSHKRTMRDNLQSWFQELLMQQNCRIHLPTPVSYMHINTHLLTKHNNSAPVLKLTSTLEVNIPIPSVSSWSIISPLSFPPIPLPTNKIQESAQTFSYSYIFTYLTIIVHLYIDTNYIRVWVCVWSLCLASPEKKCVFGRDDWSL